MGGGLSSSFGQRLFVVIVLLNARLSSGPVPPKGEPEAGPFLYSTRRDAQLLWSVSRGMPRILEIGLGPGSITILSSSTRQVSSTDHQKAFLEFLRLKYEEQPFRPRCRDTRLGHRAGGR